MSNHYEVEHNINPEDGDSSQRNTRRVDMSTFLSFLSQLTPVVDLDADPVSTTTHHIFSDPTPNDLSTLFRLLRDQLATLASTAPTHENGRWLSGLVTALNLDVDAPPVDFPGVPAEFVDGLDRVDKKRLRPDDKCPICAEAFLDDPYPLIVELPCHSSHRFDLECVEPWLRSKGSCPLCRKDFKPKPKEVVNDDGDDDDEDIDNMYA